MNLISRCADRQSVAKSESCKSTAGGALRCAARRPTQASVKIGSLSPTAGGSGGATAPRAHSSHGLCGSVFSQKSHRCGSFWPQSRTSAWTLRFGLGHCRASRPVEREICSLGLISRPRCSRSAPSATASAFHRLSSSQGCLDCLDKFGRSLGSAPCPAQKQAFGVSQVPCGRGRGDFGTRDFDAA